MFIQSSKSSKKRKFDEEDVGVSGIIHPSKATGLGHLIPLLTDFSKNSQGNSLKISADDLHIDISATKSNNNISLHKIGINTSEAQRLRKRRQRRITRSKRRKEAALKKEAIELKKQLAESKNNDSRSSYESNSEKDSMDVDFMKDTKTFQNSNAGVEVVDNVILNEESETYVVDINNTRS